MLSQKQIGTICFSIIFSIFSISAFACNSDEIDVLGDGTQCETSKFELTTTSFSGDFSVAMAFGGTIYIDWGDGSAIETITPTDTTSTTYTHSYSVTEPHTIRFGGTATEYNADTENVVSTIDFYSVSSSSRVASITGSLAQLFPQYGDEDGEYPRFSMTFRGATNLTQIPSGLFTGLTGGSFMFYNTFYGCTGIQSIPGTLFSTITTGGRYMFQHTFRECTGIQSIPGTLFSNITTGAPWMFDATFRGCTNLSGNVPNTLFSGLVNNGSPQYGFIMNLIFYGANNLSKTCPTGQVKYMTGYESEWSGAVSCRSECSNGLIGAGLNDCVPSKFEITTTSFSGNFSVTFAATGTYYIDWGDGSVQTIVRPNTTRTTYTHSYSVAEPHTIKFAGLATEYQDSAGSSAVGFTVSKIASLSGSLAQLFPQYGDSYSEFPQFAGVFQYATNLTSVPDTLFTGLTGGAKMFLGTFYGSGLTSIPSGLFSTITTSSWHMFGGTFQNCTGLQSLPAGLFSGITDIGYAMFSGTFAGCTNLSGWVPPTMFSGLIANNSPNVNYMSDGFFSDDNNLATSCPSPATTQYITGYESAWGGVVSCECATGYYGDDVTCTACTNNHPTNSSYTGRSTTNSCPWECDHGYMENNNQCDAIVCSDATYYDDNYTDIANACVNCPTGYNYNTTAGKTSVSQCQISCAAGTYLTDEYTQLEYIESSGTQWIDTGYVIGNSGTVSGSVGISSSTDKTGNVGNFAGNQGELNGKAFGGYAVNYKNGVFGLWVNPAASGASGNKATVSANKIAANTLYNLEYTITNDSSRTFSVNGTNATANLTIASTQSIKSVVSYKLFTNGCRGNGTNQTNEFTCSGAGNTPVPIQMHYVKLYDNGVLVLDLVPARRNSDGVLGMYNKVTGQFYTNAGTGTFIAGPDTNTIIAGQCGNVGVGYWSAGGITNYGGTPISRTACPAGTYTVGYGHGADEANDCGRILHLGDSVIYTRKNKPTTPALNIRMDNGDMYYIGLSTTDHTVSRLHFQTGETKYTAFDDSLFYGERDYDTGEQITQ